MLSVLLALAFAAMVGCGLTGGGGKTPEAGDGGSAGRDDARTTVRRDSGRDAVVDGRADHEADGATHVTPDAFVGVSGNTLVYQGKAIVFRGINFNNGPGMAPNLPASDINVDESDYAQAHEGVDPKTPGLGGNAVRFGLSYWWYSTDTTTDHGSFYAVIKQHVAWAKAHHLWMIPVMFIAPGNTSGGYGNQGDFWDNAGSSANRDLVTAFWTDFATHFADEPTIAAYDIINEPSPGSIDTYTAWAQQVYDGITSADAHHLVAIESTTYTQGVDAVGALPTIVTSGASRILWSQHCYPEWSYGTTCGQVVLPTAPLWIGETGVYRGDAANFARYPAFLTSFNANKISFTHFVMRSWYQGDDYGLYGYINGVDGQDQGPGGFLNPWPEMIQLVQSATAGNTFPE